ncbi:MAG: nodulation protein NolW [Hyphomicrobium sp.]|uniref:nodulation protein NolW n=1 Tax=Hyphomicrobium sp. TaxID=82 RepID=UPI00356B2ACB
MVMMLDVRKLGMSEAQARVLSPDPERRERLEYLADLLSELKTLAERERCAKLPDLIAQSREEAIAESLKR